MVPIWLKLIGKGIGMGILHVLTGPDHLSALATLSANGGFSSFKYGIRWGIGHSTGLVIVGTIMIALSSGKQKVGMPDFVTYSLEALVGIFMLLLGGYSMFKISKRRKENYYCAQNSLITVEEITSVETNEDSYSYDQSLHRNDEVEIEMEGLSISNTGAEGHKHGHTSSLHQKSKQSSNCGQLLINVCCPLTICRTGVYQFFELLSSIKIPKQIIAFCVGIVHGVAGPGGILGVIPAVNLHDWKLATIYLTYFCCTSTIVMGLYALVYGTCSSKLSSVTNLDYQIELFSASLSIIVGVLWLSFLAFGILVP